MKKFRTKMRKTLKGGVCLALAVCMMIAFIPATGATGTETTTAPTYEYVFSKDKLSPATEGSNYPMASATSASFVDEEKGYSWQPLGVMTSSGSAFFAEGYQWFEKATNTTRLPLGKNGTVVKITVGETANYKPYISYWLYKFGANINIYLSDQPYTGTNQPKSYVQGITGVSTTSISYILSGSFNTHDETATSTFKNKETKDFGVSEITLEKDKEYYLVISLDGEATQENYTTQPTNYYYHLYSFGLDKVETATEEPETVSGNVSFGAYSDVANSVTVTIDGATSENEIES
ncbi:MAG: hypothetical protein IJB42_05620, partial [Oscillospiraceae bacterium]|nr:hypothetical protein [Oscillospiraceae bacterium]